MTPQVLILAAGQGERFWPLSRNKALYQFFGQPLLVHNLNRLSKAGFSQAIIVTNLQDKDTISRVKVKGLSLKTAIQSRPLGMADAVISAQNLISAQPLLIMNAEDVVDQSLYLTVFRHLQDGTNFIPGKKVATYFPVGYLKLRGTKVTEIVEKPGAGHEPSDLITPLFHGFQQPQKFLEILRKTRSSKDDIYEVALSTLLKITDFQVLRYDGPWQATKYPWDILAVMKLLFQGVKPNISQQAQVAKTAVVQRDVIIEAGVKVFENAVIKGPAYIGRNTIIGNGALVRESTIGDNCVVGFNTEVARSWVGDNCWFHSNYIGDSVLEANVALGAGAILANLRLDEKAISSVVKGEKISTGTNKLGAIIGSNVRIGVNTSIMPGIKIGSGSFIGAGLTVDQDIPENSFVAGKTTLHIVPNSETLNPSARDTFKTKL